MNGHDMTEEALNSLEQKISDVYKDAANDVEKTVNDYFAQFEKRDAEQLKLVENGELSKNDYTQWRLTQMGRGEKYKDLQNKLAERYTNANEVAHAYIEDATPSIYSLNRNYSAYTIEQTGANVNFNLWNEAAVKNLIVQDPNLMPAYPEWKAFERGIDLAYSRERITANITSGILQGLSPYQIADNLQSSLENMNRASAIRTARTAFTSAENAGNQDAFWEAENMGIPMQKEWVATSDDRTREDHLEADGQIVDIDEPFIVGGEELMYPGDPDGEPEQVYNCRCTMIARVAGADMSDADKWAKESFEEWEEEKEESGQEWLQDTEAEEMLKSIETGDSGWTETLTDETEYKELNTRSEIDEVFYDSVKNWVDEMSSEEKDAVIGYTGWDYSDINRYMRGESSLLSEKMSRQIDDIESALSKFELTEDIVVYRRMKPDVYEEFVEVGGVFSDPGYLSTSTRSDLEGFGSEIMEIHVPAGTGRGAYVESISEFSSEREYLMQHDSMIKVESETVDEWGHHYSVGTLIVD